VVFVQNCLCAICILCSCFSIILSAMLYFVTYIYEKSIRKIIYGNLMARVLQLLGDICFNPFRDQINERSYHVVQQLRSMCCKFGGLYFSTLEDNTSFSIQFPATRRTISKSVASVFIIFMHSYPFSTYKQYAPV